MKQRKSVLSPEEVVEMRDAVRNGSSVNWLAAEYGVSAPTVSRAVRGETFSELPGAIPSLKRRMGPADEAIAHEMVARGESIAAITRALKCHWETALRLMERLGIYERGTSKHRGGRPAAVSLDKQRAIDLYSTGLPIVEVAAALGVHSSRVWRVVKAAGVSRKRGRPRSIRNV